MKRNRLTTRPASRIVAALLCAAAFTLVACDSDVNISPTAPPFPTITPIGERSLQISGTLKTAGRSCLEATILYDGQELADARVTCPHPRGCTDLALAAVTPTDAGRHTISFQVLDQAAGAVDYVASGDVLVIREGLALGGVLIGLETQSATLRSGESVTFEISFQN